MTPVHRTARGAVDAERYAQHARRLRAEAIGRMWGRLFDVIEDALRGNREYRRADGEAMRGAKR